MSDQAAVVLSGPRSPRFPSSKFAVPTPTAEVVHRPRLLRELDRGEQARLTLVAGSPGSGKTVLLADWLASRPDRHPVWVSCDPADADPVRLLAALIEALRRASGQAGVGEDARQLLSLDGEVSADVMAALVDDLEGLDGSWVAVVDDLHLAGPTGADPLGMLIEYQPEQLQLVVASRGDPPLRLHRLRGSSQLVELRDDDLSFSMDETRALFSRFDVKLRDRDLTLVHKRSEGWVAGLQMAAISIHDATDPADAARRVDLDRNMVADYFLHEVLYRQPPEVADFMLATSILDELSPDACTAVYGERSQPLLSELHRSHLFVTIASEQEGSYRYHHMIKAVLEAELHDRDPGRKCRLHEIAAQHLAEAGQVNLAAKHLLAAGDASSAFRLLTHRVVHDYAARPRVGSALDVDDLQPDVFAGSPEILVPLAAELLLRGVFEPGARALALAERACIDADQRADVVVRLSLVRSLYYTIVGRLDESLAERQLARQSLSEPRDVEDWLLGLDVLAMYCHIRRGDLALAGRLANEIAMSPASPPPVTEVICPGGLSEIALSEGNLGEAVTQSSRALAAARRLGLDHHFFAYPAVRVAALLALEHRDFATAIDLIEQNLGMQSSGGRPIFNFLAQLDRARIWGASGHLEEALASLPPARAALKCDSSPLLCEADELEARFRLAIGDRVGAEAASRRLPPARNLVIGAMIALSGPEPHTAARLLERAPADGSTIRSDLELRLLRAGAAIAQGSQHTARLVRRALVVVERHGFVQTALDTAPQLVDHLVSDSIRYDNTEGVRALIAAGLQAREFLVAHTAAEKLTDAEMRVLVKLPEQQTYADLAADLYLSQNTVKTHLRHIYAKLGVTSRSAAVRRASALGLI